MKIEISPGGIGFIRTTAVKPGPHIDPAARRKAWIEHPPPELELELELEPESDG